MFKIDAGILIKLLLALISTVIKW